MLHAGEYADLLGAAGEMLDAASLPVQAQIDIVIRGATISMVALDSDSQERIWTAAIGVRRLLELTGERPRETPPNPMSEHAKRLRVIGQILDDQGVALERLTMLPDRSRALGHLNRYSLAQWFTTEDIVARAGARAVGEATTYPA